MVKINWNRPDIVLDLQQYLNGEYPGGQRNLAKKFGVNQSQIQRQLKKLKNNLENEAVEQPCHKRVSCTGQQYTVYIVNNSIVTHLLICYYI